MMGPSDKRILPVIFVLQTDGGQNSRHDRIADTIVQESLLMIRKVTGGSDMDVRVSTLLFGARTEWLTVNASADTDLVSHAAVARTNLSSALRELNGRLTREGDHALCVGICHVPIIIYVTNGRSADDCEAAIRELDSNPWYKRAIRICFPADEKYDASALARLAPNILERFDPNRFESLIRYVCLQGCIEAEAAGPKNAPFPWNDGNRKPRGIGSAGPMNAPIPRDDGGRKPRGEFDFAGPEDAPIPRDDGGRKPHGEFDFAGPKNAPPPRDDDRGNDRGAGPGSEVDLKRVEFSAIAPRHLARGDYSVINVVMYEESARDIVDRMIREMDGPAQESRSGIHKVREDSQIRVVLSSADIEIDDAEETGVWQGGHLNFSFSVFLPEGYGKRSVSFTASVYINDVIACKLKFIVRCFSLFDQKIAVSRENILSAFVSYASQDRNRVAAIIQGMQKARPDMEIFFDVESLRSGDDWEKELHKEIEKRDVLFLCWSHFARESSWVDAEWRYALAMKGAECIEPVPIEPPDVCPPPAELSHKHFNDKLLYVINASNRQGARTDMENGWE